MSMISERVKELRELADYLSLDLSEHFDFTDEGNMIRKAADTIEALSAKVSAANKELERWHTDRTNERIKNPFANTSTLICQNCDHKDEYIEKLEAEVEELKSANMEQPERHYNSTRINPPKEGDIVQHFKRETVEDKEHSMEYLYIIERIATHTETNEKFVIYRALYKNDKTGAHYNSFARPYNMFMEEVDHEKYPDIKQKYRFEVLEVNDTDRSAAQS